MWNTLPYFPWDFSSIILIGYLAVYLELEASFVGQIATLIEFCIWLLHSLLSESYKSMNEVSRDVSTQKLMKERSSMIQRWDYVQQYLADSSWPKVECYISSQSSRASHITFIMLDSLIQLKCECLLCNESHLRFWKRQTWFVASWSIWSTLCAHQFFLHCLEHV